jgi:trans-aconitate 2-methyltransferase
MPTWNPLDYLTFVDHRLRPTLDLLAQIPLDNPSSVYDLGCGPGHVTRLLAQRWPAAAVTGIDSSAEMLTTASEGTPNVTFLQADIAQWSPPGSADLLFSSATLHWLDNHWQLLPRIVAHLAPSGVLAVQMPNNRDAPCHRLIDAVAADGPWRSQLSKVRGWSAESAESYYKILAPLTHRVDIWETEHLHVLEGDNPVFQWIKGAALRPYLDAFDKSTHSAFLAACANRIAAAYPKQPDGRTLLPFRRMFLIAQA